MSKIVTSRRSFIAGLAALVAAPAIVNVSSIMPVKAYETVNVDELVALLARRMEEAESCLARRVAQSLYSDGNQSMPLGGLAKLIQEIGPWKHREQAVVIEMRVPYVRVAPELVRNQRTGRMEFADGHLKIA